jgi:hypothetical protein
MVVASGFSRKAAGTEPASEACFATAGAASITPKNRYTGPGSNRNGLEKPGARSIRRGSYFTSFP